MRAAHLDARGTVPLPPQQQGADAGWRQGSRLLLAMASVLALAGLGVAIYLSVTHATGQSIACTGIGDCNYVNGSEYSKVAGVPVAMLGAGAYVTIFTFATGALLMRWRSWLLAAWSVAFASFAFSLYLTYIELFVLEAICVWCVASASIATALFLALTGVLFAEPPRDT